MILGRTILAVAAGLLVAASVSHSAVPSSDPSEKPAGVRPVPDSGAQAKALSLIEELYKPYPPVTVRERRALGIKLLADGETSDNDPAAQYVLFEQAAKLACSADDFQTTVKAVDERARVFAIRAADEKLTLLKSVNVARLVPNVAGDYADAALVVGWDAMRGGGFEDASRAASLATRAVPLAGNPMLTRSAQVLTRDAKKGQIEADRVKEAESKLKADPHDAAASLAMGHYLCFWRGNWGKGLPMLAVGSDVLLKAIAAEDLGSPATPNGQFDLAGKWYHLANGETGVPRSQIRKRARYWYTQSASRLHGLQAALVERNLAELKTPDEDDPDSFATKELALTRLLNDPAHWKVGSGKWKNKPGRLRGEGDSGIEFDSPLPEKIAFDMRLNVISGMRPRLEFKGTGITLGTEGYSNNLLPRGGNTTDPLFMYKNGQSYLLGFDIGDGHFNVEIDHKPVFKSTCQTGVPIHLFFRGGDSFSRGTCEFSDFSVESFSDSPPSRLP